MTHRRASRVLVVAAPGARAMEHALDDERFIVEVAPDAPTALELVGRSSPDVALLDVAMPGGAELVETLRARGIGVIALSAVASDALAVAVEEAIEAASLRRAHREALSTLAHDVRASLAVVSMVLPAFATTEPRLERKLALAKQAVERACATLQRALELASREGTRDEREEAFVAVQNATAAAR